MTAPVWLFHQTTSLSKVAPNASAELVFCNLRQLKQIKTMAGVRKIQKGDLVLYKKNLCIVADIRNPIGFNQFDVMDFDGKMFPAVLRQELDLCDIETFDTVEMDWLNFEEFTEKDCDSSDATATSTEQRYASGGSGLPLATKVEQFQVHSNERKPSKNRFKQVSEQDIEMLASSTTARSTDNQTKWAVKIFKGIYICNVNPPGYHTNVI